ncbi:MAG: hypothetical protein WCJ99_09910 [Betaproteobacteria bacterium]
MNTSRGHSNFLAAPFRWHIGDLSADKDPSVDLIPSRLTGGRIMMLRFLKNN